ncbi:putative iron-regulated membrane protein [Deinobacterium chartae]|uniref:Putative iron-regulated membrane protein n=1 Tax=Deinobacterium chartae TaxID=521158 RepID=A0A841I2D2_9DEIO|nr:putative iron-regulated membrane protein [Deinobacterium chartae]
MLTIVWAYLGLQVLIFAVLGVAVWLRRAEPVPSDSDDGPDERWLPSAGPVGG